MSDPRPRCGDQGPGHGDTCILRPGHEGDHHHQPKGMPRSAARQWPRKPTLADGVKKTPLPAKDERATAKDSEDPGLSKPE